MARFAKGSPKPQRARADSTARQRAKTSMQFFSVLQPVSVNAIRVSTTDRAASPRWKTLGTIVLRVFPIAALLIAVLRSHWQPRLIVNSRDHAATQCACSDGRVVCSYRIARTTNDLRVRQKSRVNRMQSLLSVALNALLWLRLHEHGRPPARSADYLHAEAEGEARNSGQSSHALTH